MKKKTGNTSEEVYVGGGTIVSYDGVEVQSKIPSSFYSLDIESLLKQKTDLSIKDVTKLMVLVYHSHTTESYALLDVGCYTKSLTPRTTDEAQNMVRVGDELCSYLENLGISVIHDITIHDTDYNSSYASSRESIEEYLEKYPSIEITIDVHRDDITYSDNTKVKPTAEVNGKKAARMMIIAGAEYGSIENFPDWEYNLRFDLAVQQKANELYPGLMRPILFSQRKYNMDETKNSFLLEIGTDANTLDEACYLARLFAVALAELIQTEYVTQ
ncbi:MAG: stage II sporulation protein P [Clostridiales bacterium]|nr:stage II sporulation protein P [Clostridiales bacterium]